MDYQDELIRRRREALWGQLAIYKMKHSQSPRRIEQRLYSLWVFLLMAVLGLVVIGIAAFQDWLNRGVQ